MSNQSTIEEYMELVVPVTESGCWLWMGDTENDCGHLIVNNKDVFADRVFWEAYHGRIPQGQKVCHKCRVQSCVNPEHLYLQAS